MITSNEKQLTTTDVRVFEKYEYRLSQLQPASGQAVILPYVKRREIGLVQINIE